MGQVGQGIGKIDLSNDQGKKQDTKDNGQILLDQGSFPGKVDSANRGDYMRSIFKPVRALRKKSTGEWVAATFLNTILGRR